MDLRITEQDHELLLSRGILPEDIKQQISLFKEGLKAAGLHRPCTIGDGILQIADADHQELLTLHKKAADAGKITKFVPASGAATRMFKSLLEGLQDLDNSAEADADIPEQVTRFIDNLAKFAFGSQLISACGENARPATMLRTLLATREFGYATLPKGLIPFHKYVQGSRTAFEEHLVEALTYARDAEGIARLHFTVAEDYRDRISAFLDGLLPRYSPSGTQFDIQYSVQHSSTDTIAVTLDNEPLRDGDGFLVFRPGGHGALLKNLNALKGDILFVKNIDNVVPDRLKKTTIIYKRLLAGLLVKLQNQCFQFLQELESGNRDRSLLEAAVTFMRSDLQLKIVADPRNMDDDSLADFVFRQLNRPLRVCGMVKNEGEPGGGPFWVRGDNDTVTAQIVESAQVNLEDPAQQNIWQSSTHFNPVDLVCGVRDFRGQPFELTDFRDPRSGFIAKKSYHGRDIKALELPGLWNGAMAYWNTVFVEVPIITFNPVKTVFDLLRDEHQ